LKNDSALSKDSLLVNDMLLRVINLHHSVTPLKDIFWESIESSSEVTDAFGPATLYTSLFFEMGSEQTPHRDTPYFYSGSNGGYMGV